MLVIGSAPPTTGRAIEAELTRARRALLKEAMAESSAAASVDYAVALAQKMHRSEYAFSASPDEQAGVSNLETRIAERIRASRDVPALWIAALACYRPLLGTPVDDERLVASADRGLAPLLAECIHEARALKARASNVKSLQPIADEVSLRVGEQYEENPYPRWHSGDWSALEPMTLTDYLTKGLPGLNTEIAFPARPKVLIAGCGTGQHAIVVAKQLPDAEILAIDLSRPSLAYASIRAEEASVRNVAFRQADILGLNSAQGPFDYIECCGVLHHLRAPAEGLTALTHTLKPDGILRLALYSRTARRHIQEIRDLLGPIEDDLTSDEIRSIRKQVLYEIEERNWTYLFQVGDLYSLSGFRDLFLNRVEHSFTVDGLAALLDEAKLRFLRMNVMSEALAVCANVCPEDTRGEKLSSWQRVEAVRPDTFLGMYDLLVKKAGTSEAEATRTAQAN